MTYAETSLKAPEKRQKVYTFKNSVSYKKHWLGTHVDVIDELPQKIETQALSKEEHIIIIILQRCFEDSYLSNERSDHGSEAGHRARTAQTH